VRDFTGGLWMVLLATVGGRSGLGRLPAGAGDRHSDRVGARMVVGVDAGDIETVAVVGGDRGRSAVRPSPQLIVAVKSPPRRRGWHR